MAVNKFTTNQYGDKSITSVKIADGTIVGANLAANLVVPTSLKVMTGSTEHISISSTGTTVGGNLHVNGNITFTGTIDSTVVTEQVLEIADAQIKLRSGQTTAPGATDHAYVYVERGTSADTYIQWDEGNDYWSLSNDGTNAYRIVTQTFNKDLTMDSSSTTALYLRFATGANANLADHGGISWYENGTGSQYNARLYYDGTSVDGDGKLIFAGTAAEGTMWSISRSGLMYVKDDVKLGSAGDINFNDKHYIGPNTRTALTYDGATALRLYTASDYFFYSPGSNPAHIQLFDGANSNNYKFLHDGTDVLQVLNSASSGYKWFNNDSTAINTHLMNLTAAGTLNLKAQLQSEGTGHNYFKGTLSVGTDVVSGRLHVYNGDLNLNGGVINMSDTVGVTKSIIRSDETGARIWMIGGSGTPKVIISDAYNSDRGISLSYAPGTTGAGTGIFTIGQQDKNNANYTHGITRFYTNGTEKVRIDKDGNVGIGYTAMTDKLEVNGAIKATSLKVGSINVINSTADWGGTTIPPLKGGTGVAAYVTGDMLYASAANVLSNLAIGSTGQVLTVASGLPSWASLPADKYLSAVAKSNSTNIGNVTFTIANGSNIVTDFSHTHTNDHASGSDNQNLFSSVVVNKASATATGTGEGTITASSQTTSLGIIAGSNITLNHDVTNKVIKISSSYVDTNTWQANTVSQDGYVTAPTVTNANKVWKTDASGNPSWRDDADTDTATATDDILDGSNTGTAIKYSPYAAQQAKLSFDISATAPTRTDRLNLNGYLYATKLYSGGNEVLTTSYTPPADKYLSAVSGTCGGTITFTITNGTNVTWNSAHSHTAQNAITKVTALNSAGTSLGTYTASTSAGEVKLKAGTNVTLAFATDTITINAVDAAMPKSAIIGLSSSNSYTATFTHSNGNNNYAVQLSTNSPQRHVYYKRSSDGNSVTVYLDDTPWNNDPVEVCVTIQPTTTVVPGGYVPAT